jgi:hypothetical protein
VSIDKYVCNLCVLDEALSAQILEEGEDRGCDYCGATPSSSELRSLSIRDVADHIHELILQEYSDVDSEMVSYDNEEGCYYCETYTTYELLTDQVGLEAEEDVIDDIVGSLPDLTWCKKRFHPNDLTHALMSGWEVFIDLVKHHTRYFLYDPSDPVPERDPFSQSEAFGITYDGEEGVPPGQILDALGVIVARAKLVRPIDVGTVVFRARVHAADEYPSTAAELGPPSRELARQSNRMSPAGIVMFYGAFDTDTAIRETFDPQHEEAGDKVVSVAQFQCQRPLTVLDLTDLPPTPSFFGDREMYHGIRFLHEFEENFTKPVARDGMEHVEYVPTQIVTEYFSLPASVRWRGLLGWNYLPKFPERTACMRTLPRQLRLRCRNRAFAEATCASTSGVSD